MSKDGRWVTARRVTEVDVWIEDGSGAAVELGDRSKLNARMQKGSVRNWFRFRDSGTGQPLGVFFENGAWELREIAEQVPDLEF